MIEARPENLKIMAMMDRHGLPPSTGMHAANHHEGFLV